MKTAIPTHLYQPDGLPSHRGAPEGCQHCPMPARHPVHQLPPSPDGAAQYDARRLGETEER